MKSLNVDRLFVGLYLFFIIYTPAVGPVPGAAKYGFLVGGPLVAGMYLMVKRSRYVAQFLRHAPLAIFVYVSIFGSLYVALVRLFSANPVSSLLDTRLLQNNTVTLMAINVVVALCLLRELGIGRRGSFEMLLALGSFQGLFAIAGVLVPGVKAISDQLYANAGGSNEFVTAARVYGFSTDFTYGTPIYHGTLAGIAVYFCLREGRNYWIPAFLMLTTAALNGRTGVVVFAVIAVTAIVLNFVKRNAYVALVLTLGFTVGAAVLSLVILERYVPSSFQFISSFLDDTKALFQEGELQGNYKWLAEGLAMRPDGMGLIFGEGSYLYNLPDRYRTDVGFTIDLFAGGLVYIVLVYGAFLLFVLDNDTVPPFIKYSLVVMFLFANVKGEVFRSSILLFLALFLVVNYAVAVAGRQQSAALTKSENSEHLPVHSA